MLERDPSPFLTVRAVEAWDTWFRWRDDGGLHDLAVETTWQRVAAALGAGATAGVCCADAVFAAQACWQLVFDERILANAGTGAPLPDDPVAVLNAAAFVEIAPGAAPSFDFAAFGEVAVLAVRCLDNAARSVDTGACALDLRVGMIGLADALVLLGIRYDSSEGRVTAAAIARTLAEGCLRGSIALAAERGRLAEADGAQLTRARARRVPEALVESIGNAGVRHRCLTTISPHPRLAAFANGVSDGIDPIDGAARAAAMSNAPKHSSALPFALLHLHGTVAPAALTALLPDVTLADRLLMRNAVQPWIDRPIESPSLVRTDDADSARVPSAAAYARRTLAAPTH